MYQYLETRAESNAQTLFQKGEIHFLEIRIQNLERKLPVIAVVDQVLSSPTDNHWVVKAHLQPQFYDDLIPVSLLHEGISCEITTDVGRSKLGTGHVVRRWFEPATGASWQNSPIPEQDQEKMEYSRTFSSGEYNRIKLGSIPLQMEDHWFGYFEDDKLFWHRSWTGLGIYTVLIENLDNQYRVTQALYNKSATPEIASFKVLDSLMNGLCREAKILE